MPIEFGGSSATSTGAYNPVGDALAAINSGMDAFKKYQEQKLLQQTIDAQNADAALLARYAQPVQQQVSQSPVSISLPQIAAALKGGNEYAPVGVPSELGGNPAVQGAPTPVTIQQIARIADMGNAPQQAQDSMPFALQALDNMVKSNPAAAASYFNRHQADPIVKAYNDWQAGGVARETAKAGLISAQLKNAKEGFDNADLVAGRVPGTPQYAARMAGFQKPVVDLTNATTEGKLKAGELGYQPTKQANESAQSKASTAASLATASEKSVQTGILKKELTAIEGATPEQLAHRYKLTDSQQPPSGYEWIKTEDGRKILKAIPGGPATKMSPEDAVKTQGLVQGVENMSGLKTLLFTTGTDGKPSLNRATILEMNAMFPGSVGRKLNAMIDDTIEAQLRAETGAAVNKEEIPRIRGRYVPSAADSYDTAMTKINLLDKRLKGALGLIMDGKPVSPQIVDSLVAPTSPNPSIAEGSTPKFSIISVQ